jgi:hypothetical protein
LAIIPPADITTAQEFASEQRSPHSAAFEETGCLNGTFAAKTKDSSVAELRHGRNLPKALRDAQQHFNHKIRTQNKYY